LRKKKKVSRYSSHSKGALEEPSHLSFKKEGKKSRLLPFHKKGREENVYLCLREEEEHE